MNSTNRRTFPKYLQLAKSFERQLKTGVLRVGDRLPSVRQLRDEHHVSVATVVGCYLWLERQGYVRAQPKSGFYVRRCPVANGESPAIATRVKGPVLVRLDAERGTLNTMYGESNVLDLGPAVVSPTLLPMNRLNRSIRIALSAFADNAVCYEDTRGNQRLRRQIARLIFRQGSTCSPEELIVTSGETEALNLAIRAVASPGDVVAVESPGCYAILQALEALRMRAIEIPHVPQRGIDLAKLGATAEKYQVKAILVAATCHNTFGDCASEDSKAEIVRFATAMNIPVVEGDPFGDLVFTGVRPRPLKAFDKTGIVLQCSSFAHYVAPGFNLGWISGGRWHKEVERVKGFTNLASASLPQLAFAEFLESGAFDKHVKQLRLRLCEIVDASRREVLKLFPEGTRVSQPDGGFVLWIQLPEGSDGLDMQRRAAAAGIKILAGPAFSPGRLFKDCIRISCGHPFEVMKPAIRKLASLSADGRT